MSDEIVNEIDIYELYELSIANQEAEERAEIMEGLMQNLVLVGAGKAYLEKIRLNIFKANTADIDNKKLMYLKNILERKIQKLVEEEKIHPSNIPQLYI